MRAHRARDARLRRRLRRRPNLLYFLREGFDVSGVHFASDPDHFRAMLEATWAALLPGGLFFCRLASNVGIEDRNRSVGAGRFAPPEGSEHGLVNAEELLSLSARLGGEPLDPLKTTVVHAQRAMTSWVLRKAGGCVGARPQ